ncbi:MAG: GNAT family N-acetyltransferase [Lachnospiraceae bacterium]|nr:GNAT family N-acetyltransferase [Lachnospiraceae bacterium]
MELMIHGKYINQGEDLNEVLKMREEIFSVGGDEKDPDAINILVSLEADAADEGVLIGCGRLNFDLDAFRFSIDFVGIREEFRRNGYGEFALRTLVDKVNQCGADKVYVEKELVQTEEAEHFFKKMFFVPCEEDDRFLTAKIDSFHTCCH